MTMANKINNLIDFQQWKNKQRLNNNTLYLRDLPNNHEKETKALFLESESINEPDEDDIYGMLIW